MQVAVLTATLEAQIAAFQMNMRAADSLLNKVQKQMAETQAGSVALSKSLDKINLANSQVANIVTNLKTVSKQLDSVTKDAEVTSSALKDVKLPASAAAETVANAAVEKRALKELRDQAISTTAALSTVNQRSSLGTFMGRAYASGPATTGRVLGYNQYGSALFGNRIGPSGTMQYASPIGPMNRRTVGPFGAADGSLRNYGLTSNMTRSLEEQLSRAGHDISGGGGRRGGGGGLFGLGGGRNYNDVPGPNFLAGILPGGRRARPAAILSAVGAGLATVPALGPAAGGLAAAAPAAVEGLLGSLGVLKLAFNGMSGAAFTTKKAFEALSAPQKEFVQNLRSLGAGVGSHLSSIAQNKVLPGITSAISSAVTPASINAITNAVEKFSSAVSGAAQVWGKLIGSAQFAGAFGAVLASSARYAEQFFVGLSHLLDAMIHLQQAAIPFTNWLFTGILNFTKWADAAVVAAQKTGALSSFFDRAKTSLQALGGLIANIGRALGAVFDVAGFSGAIQIINLISKGFGALAGAINANRKVLHDVFEGGIKAVGDFLVVTQGLVKYIVGPLLKALNAIAKQIGGWRPIIDAVFGFFILKSALSVKAVDKLILRLLGLGPAGLAGAAGAEAGEAGIAAGAEAATGSVLVLRAALVSLAGPLALAAAAGYAVYKTQQWIANGAKVNQTASPAEANRMRQAAFGTIQPATNYNPLKGVTATGSSAAETRDSPGRSVGFVRKSGSTTKASSGLTPGSSAWWIKQIGYDPYGTPPPLKNTGGGGGGGSGAVPALTAPETALQKATQKYVDSTSSGATNKQIVAAAKDYITQLEKIKRTISALNESGKKDLTVQRELTTIARDLANAKKTQAKAEAAIATAQKAQKEMKQLGVADAGSSSNVAVANNFKKLNALIKSGGPALVVSDLRGQINAINKVLKEGIANSTVRQAASDNLANLKTEVQQRIADLVSAAKDAVTNATSDLTDSLGNIQSAADQVFTAATNAQVQTMTDSMNLTLKNMQIMVSSAAGNFLFGGDITKTPAQTALEAAQDAHDTVQRTLALTNATQAMIVANATGNPQTIFDARLGVDDANFAISQAALSAQASTQQDAATKQLQDAQDAYQKQQQAAIQNYQDMRGIQQTAMDQQVADFIKDMQQYPNSADYYLQQVNKVWSDNGVTLGKTAFSVGGVIYTSFADALGPLGTLLDTLKQKLIDLAKLPGGKALVDQMTAPFVPDASKPGFGMYVDGQTIFNASNPAPQATNTNAASSGAAMFRMLNPLMMASGGIVNKPTLAVVGEKGREAVIPLPTNGGLGGALHVTHNIDVNLNGRQLTTVIREELIRLGRSNTTIFTGPGVSA